MYYFESIYGFIQFKSTLPYFKLDKSMLYTGSEPVGEHYKEDCFRPELTLNSASTEALVETSRDKYWTY